MDDSVDVGGATYHEVLKRNAPRLRIAAIDHLREAPDHEAVLVNVSESPDVRIETCKGFIDVDVGRSALAELGVDVQKRSFLVLRPVGCDLSRLARQPDIDVEWIDNGQRHAEQIEGARPTLAEWLRERRRSWVRKSHDVSNVKLDLADKEARGAATGAVMAHVLSRPDSIRQRAQNAATISGALAVALVVAAVTGLTDEGESFQDWTTGLVCGAIVLFAISTMLSVYTVVFPHSRSGQTNYRQLIKEYEAYADEVRQKMRLAATVTASALALTALAVVVEIWERQSNDPKPMSLVLSAEALSGVARLCSDGLDVPDDPGMAPQLSGELDEDELANNFVEVKNIAVHNRRGRASTGCDVKLPRKSIRAVTAHE